MPINTQELINIISEIASEDNIKVSVRESVRGGLITGIAATLGGLLLGPGGFAVGGVVGGVTAAKTGNNFRPVAEIILNDLTAAQKALLVNRVNNIIRDIGPSDVIQLTALLMSNRNIRNSVVTAVREFVTQDLSLQLM